MQPPYGDPAELDFSWASEVGSPPPVWGSGRLPADLSELASLRWDDCVRYARAIVGRELFGSETRRLQVACGFSLFRGKRKAAKPGDNPTNRERSKEAKRKRVRVLAYVASALRRAARKGAECDIFKAFKAGCVAVFGKPQPYGCRTKVKAFHEWVADHAARLAEKMSPTPATPSNSAGRGMSYAPTGAKEDDQNLTHPVDTQGEPAADLPKETAFGVAAEGGKSASASGVPARLVGLARQALPAFAALHGVWKRVAWEKHDQAGWAVKWLSYWLSRGKALVALRRIYREHLHRFDTEAMQPEVHGLPSPRNWGRLSAGGAGWGAGQALPFILRRRLQDEAATLPSFAPEAFAGRNPAAALPEVAEARKSRSERRDRIRADRSAAREQFPGRRARRKSPAAVAAVCAAVGFGQVAAGDLAARKAAWAAKFNAAIAGADYCEAHRVRSLAAADGVTL